MKDRFRFRAWDKTQNKMIEDIQNSINWNGTAQGMTTFDDYLDDENYIVMQCTGLKDKNGKLIYEGDILKWCVDDDYKPCEPQIKQVVWHCGSFQFRDEEKHDADLTLAMHNIKGLFRYTEIIGNIYKNPELLEEK